MQFSNTSAFPYRATCRIKTDVYGEELVASGLIVGPSLLLTNTHCVMGSMVGYGITIMGYPNTPGYGQLQYYTQGNIDEAHFGYFLSNAKSTGGMSGAPIVMTTDKNYAIGINKGHLDENPDVEIGVKITQTIIDVILANKA